MRIVVLGLSITSSWGNGHATTYRALLREFARLGHRTLFLERDMPWYAENRDAPTLPYVDIGLYRDEEELKTRFAHEIGKADAVIVGSYVPNGTAIGEWVLSVASGPVAFYDIDTPVTLARLARGDCDYVSEKLIRQYSLYLSFTGGPTLRRLETDHGSPMARALYCAVDPASYYPERLPTRWALGYLGTYSADRQPTLDRLLVQPAQRWGGGRFVVAGPQYPESLAWPSNVERIHHLPPAEHRRFYNQQRFTLNVTRADMIAAGYSPSVRLFEAAACGTVIISDPWEGLDSIFALGEEILVAQSTDEVLGYLHALSPERGREIGEAARRKVLTHHTAAHRAEELQAYLGEVLQKSPPLAGQRMSA